MMIEIYIQIMEKNIEFMEKIIISILNIYLEENSLLNIIYILSDEYMTIFKK